ncbi:MAG: hypothetical protein ACREH5_08010 [Candidatus Omnitrophota bacterium]
MEYKCGKPNCGFPARFRVRVRIKSFDVPVLFGDETPTNVVVCDLHKRMEDGAMWDEILRRVLGPAWNPDRLEIVFAPMNRGES